MSEEFLSVREKRELDMTRPRRNRARTPIQKNTAKLRAMNANPERLAMLRARVAKWREEGKLGNCRGVRHGWAKARLKLWHRLRAEAEEKAKWIMKELENQGIIPKEAAGNAALQFAVEVVVGKDPEDNRPIYSVRERMQAAKMVLDFTMPKPEVKSSVRVETAESFLEGILAPRAAE